jgi:hypothetical protein
LALLFGVNNVHLVPRIKETKFGPECFGNFTWVRRDVWCLWGYSNKHLHQEVARWHIGGIERAHKANVVLWVSGMKTELLMQFADRRLLRSLASFEFATRKSDLSAVSAAFSPLDQQHLTVERMRINALTAARRAAAPQGQRGHKERGHHRNARITAGRRIEVNRLKAWQAERGECLWERKGECGETPRRIATERLLNTVCESVDQRVRSARPARCPR